MNEDHTGPPVWGSSRALLGRGRWVNPQRGPSCGACMQASANLVMLAPCPPETARRTQPCACSCTCTPDSSVRGRAFLLQLGHGLWLGGCPSSGACASAGCVWRARCQSHQRGGGRHASAPCMVSGRAAVAQTFLMYEVHRICVRVQELEVAHCAHTVCTLQA